MKIEGAAQARPEYRKTTASATPSKTFGQVMQTAKAQDHYSTPVLDLGCGAGNDTASLLARGRRR